MVGMSSSLNVARPVSDPTSFILAAQAGINICCAISIYAGAILASEMYKDPSLMNPWSERNVQMTWSSPERLLVLAVQLPMFAAMTLRNMVAHEKEKAILNEVAARYGAPLIP